MSASKIGSPREFFDSVVDPDVSDFVANSVNLRKAFHACTSLLSLRDWIFEAYKNKTWSSGGRAQTAFRSKEQFQTALESLDKKFEIVTDIANASKHMILDQNRSRTNLWGSANTAVQTTGGGIGGPIGAPIGGAVSRIVVKIDDTYHDVGDFISSTHRIWSALMTENSW